MRTLCFSLDVVTLELCLYLIKEFLCYQWLMFPLIPVVTFHWSLKDSIVEGMAEYSVYPRECQWFVASCIEIGFKAKPIVYLVLTPPFLVGYFLKHLLDDWCLVHLLSPDTSVHVLLIQVSKWCCTYPQSHFSSLVRSPRFTFTPRLSFSSFA